MPQEDKIQDILTAQSMAFEALDIIDQIKVNKNYIPSREELNYLLNYKNHLK